MEIKQLSTNGFCVTDIFSKQIFEYLDKVSTSFVPVQVQMYTETIKREVFRSTDSTHKIVKNIVHPIASKVTDDFSHICGVELWRDYPGYTNAIHYDDPVAQNIMIVYLGDDILDVAGTEYFENDQHFKVDYKKNTGLILLNSDKIKHGLVGEVPNNVIRRTVYINWITKQRYNELK